ncbi:MAG: 6,7-dimethyl-8-ribityllumazine synthase [Bacteroidales bacterium]|nr:6,7-dimethyl-8-ribityllumazine synthase [Bacteroidales bacterium]MDY3913205.1 6,7-dimethyl-8-ribityllumazine synthase [Sodaliphilus sp.]
MSTELRSSDRGAAVKLPHVPGLKVGVVAAEWNAEVTDALLKGVTDRLAELGYPANAVETHRVPGTVELTFGASQLARTGRFSAVIMIGCVIRGGTPHFDYVCDNATQGCAYLNATGNVPVIFCVLTTENQQQAIDRAGGALGNKGTEAADAAVQMAAFKQALK